MVERRLSRGSNIDGKKYATKFNFKETSRDNFFPNAWICNTFVK